MIDCLASWFWLYCCVVFFDCGLWLIVALDLLVLCLFYAMACLGLLLYT